MRHQRLLAPMLLEGGEWTDKHATGCDTLSFSQIGADVSEEPIASASAFHGPPYIVSFFSTSLALLP